jgi:hypothetical protein
MHVDEGDYHEAVRLIRELLPKEALSEDKSNSAKSTKAR